VAKNLREKCMNKEVRNMIRNTGSISELWKTIDKCYRGQKNIQQKL
jgi:hypothetical protein